MEHNLKCWPEHFRDVIHSDRKKRKTVEIRRVDRPFKVGDTLHLQEYKSSDQSYTGAWADVLVTHCLRGDPWLPDGYVAMSIQLVTVFTPAGESLEQ